MEVRGAGRAAGQGKRPHHALAAGLPRDGRRDRRIPRRLPDGRPAARGGGTVDAAGDHRLAMAFAMAAGAPPRPRPSPGARGRRLVSGVLRRSSSGSRRGDGRQDLPGRLHGGGQDHGGAGARARLGWRAEDVDELIEARERRPVADIFAAAASRISAPSSARSSRCCCRCATSSSRPAAARSSIREPARDQPRRLVGLARRAVRRCWRACPPTAAGRWRPTAPDGAAVRRPPGRLRAGPPPRSTSGGAGRRDRRADRRSIDRTTDVTRRALSDPLRHPRQPRGARRGARRRRGAGTACSCSATSSATAPSRTRSSIASARSSRSR